MTLDLSKLEIDEDAKNLIQEQFNAAIGEVKTEFEQNTTGLKSKNEELLSKLKAAKDKTSGLDVDAINSLLKQMNDAKEADMIKNGQFEELVNLRVDAALKEQGDQIKTAHERAKEFEDKYTETIQANNKMQVENAITLASGKIEDLEPSALGDVLRQASATWQVKEGKLVAYDGEKQLFDKEANPLSEAQWIEGLRETSPHYFSKATGTGATGNGGGTTHAAGDLNGDSKARAAYLAGKYNLPAN